MTASSLDIQPPPAPRPVEWTRAWRSLRGLVSDPERTDFVFELIQALGGDSGEKSFQRFIRHPNGRPLLEERPSLLARLSDRSSLEGLPDGSLGRAYARFMGNAGIDAQGLVDAAEQVPSAGPVDPHRSWFFDRLRDQHDLWHVLTGYDADEAGEAALLPFSWGQMGGRANALLSIGVFLRKPGDDLTARRRMLQSWRRSRRCAWLPALRYEELLGKPLDEVRAAVRLA